MLVLQFTNVPKRFPDVRRRMRAARGGPVAHLGRERGTSPACPAGRWFCPGPSASSPTTPARLWSTGPLPGSPASSCGCAARPGSLRHNQRSHGKRKKKQQRQRNKHIPTLNVEKLPCCTSGEKGKNKQTKTHTSDQLKQGCANKEQFGFLFCRTRTKQDKRDRIQKHVCLQRLPRELPLRRFFTKNKSHSVHVNNKDPSLR